MTTSYWEKRPDSINETLSCDIVIVGAGYVGLSTAYWLSEIRPDLNIIILDQNLSGSGASGRNAGFLTIGSAQFYKNLHEKWGPRKSIEINTFAKESLNLLEENIFKVIKIPHQVSSSLTLFKSESVVHDWGHGGFNCGDYGFQQISQERLQEKVRTNFLTALESDREFKINPMNLLKGLVEILQKRRVRILEKQSAFSVVSYGLKTEKNTIYADKIILALNGYFPHFHPEFKKYIVPKRAQMLAVELDDEIDLPQLYYDPLERVYWRKAEARTLLIGGKRLVDDGEDCAEFDKISSVVQDSLELYLSDQLGLKFRIIQRWAGTMGFTSNELPIMGKIQAPLEAYMIGGFSGHGMGFGFHCGKELAEVVVGISQETFFNQFNKSEIVI